MPWSDAFYYSKKRKQKDSKEFEEWKKIVTEMGLDDSKDQRQIIGDYRGHHIEISEYDVGWVDRESARAS